MKKVQVIQQCPLHQTCKELRSFLGIAGFYNLFIPNLSGKAAALTDMVGSRSPNRLSGRSKQRPLSWPMTWPQSKTVADMHMHTCTFPLLVLYMLV